MNNFIRDMDRRRVRIPDDPNEGVRVAPGTDFAKLRAKLEPVDLRGGSIEDLLRARDAVREPWWVKALCWLVVDVFALLFVLALFGFWS